MTPDELAGEAGVSRSTIYRIENGEIEEPDLPTLRRLAKAFDLPTLSAQGDFWSLLEWSGLALWFRSLLPD